MLNDDFLEPKLAQRRSDGSFRELKIRRDGIDFSSNDYLGIARKYYREMGSLILHMDLPDRDY